MALVNKDFKTGNFKKAFEKYGEEFIRQLIKELLSKDKKATGQLIKSLNFEVLQVIDGYVLNIKANEYLKYVDQGVYPYGDKSIKNDGKMPPVDKIKKWVTTKPSIARAITRHSKAFTKHGKSIKDLNKQAAWAIAKGIQKHGIKPSYVIQNTLLKIEKMKMDLGRAVALDLNEFVYQSLKEFTEKFSKK